MCRTRGGWSTAGGGARSGPSTHSGRRSRTPEAVDAALVALVDRVTGRLRKAERVARTVVLRLRFADFKRGTRSHTLGEPTDRTDTVLAAARVSSMPPSRSSSIEESRSWAWR